MVLLSCGGGGNAVWTEVIVEWGNGGLELVGFDLLTAGLVSDSGDWLGRHGLVALGNGRLTLSLTTNADTHATCCAPFSYLITLGAAEGQLSRIDASIADTVGAHLPGRLHGFDADAGQIMFEPWYETEPNYVFGNDYVFRQAAEPMTIPTDGSLRLKRLIGPPVSDVEAFAAHANSTTEAEFVQIMVVDGRVAEILPYYTAGGTGEGADYEYCRWVSPPEIDEIGDCDAPDSPGGSTQPSADARNPSPELAVEALTDYFLAAGARNYQEAWASLSESYQREYGSYEAFTAFWERVDVVGINSTDVEIAQSPNSTFTVTADLYFRLRDGTTSSEIVEVDVLASTDRTEITDYRFIRSY